MEKVDRRGFFTSIVATLLAPLVPVKEKWTFNRSHAIAYQAIATLKTTGLQEAIKLPLYNPEFRRGVIGPFPYNSDSDMYIPGLSPSSTIEFTTNDDYISEDPFQTFIVDTNEVV